MVKGELLPVTASKQDIAVFQAALRAVKNTRVPFAVGGAVAVRAYSGIWRETHDLDIFVKPENADQVLAALESVGLKLTGSDPRWLYVTKTSTTQVDIVFAFRNEVQMIDDLWIERSRPAKVASVPVLVSSPEDTIYSKTFITSRYRFDWGDNINIVVGLKGKLDWDFLKWRLKDYPALLLAELLFCLQVYPQTREYIPGDLLASLFQSAMNPRPIKEVEAQNEWFFSKDVVQRIPFDVTDP